jgi:single-strand DNA-binding protein
MASLNKVFLLGNLTRDPDLRYTANGTAVCEFGIATNRRIPTASGETREETCFVDVVVYGKRGEAFQKYFSKGKPAFVEGRLEFRQWETPEGQKRNKLRVVAENWQFVGGGGGGPGGRVASRPESAPVPRAEEEVPPAEEEGPAGASGTDDTPF